MTTMRKTLAGLILLSTTTLAASDESPPRGQPLHERSHDHPGTYFRGTYRGTYIETLRPSTGFNADCDRAIFDLPAPLPPDLRFDFIGLHNADALEPNDANRDATRLVPEDCTRSADKAVATTTHPVFRAINGFPDVDPRLKNLRSNEVPKPVVPDGTRMTLPLHGQTPPPFPPTLSVAGEAMTLGEFRSVGGYLKIRCRADGSARAAMRVYGFRPNALVTVWAIWLTTPPGGNEAGPVPLPFGGVPNLLSINPAGVGRFVRELSYCPKQVRPNGDRLMMIDLAEHWDGVVYGALPDVPFGEFRFQADPGDPNSIFTSPIGGTVTVNRGVFNMTLTPSRSYRAP